MTLSKQLILFVISLVLFLLLASVLINIQNSRIYLTNQLASHAQDTATSLGLAATNYMGEGDEIMVQAMADALFDRGDYLQIRVEYLDGNIWADRQTEVKVHGVPAWFVDLIPLEGPIGEATVMSGWRQVGRVLVRSHPGYAYEQLWRTTWESLFWFVGGTLAVLLISLLVLRRMLRPLKQVEAQADAICNREFPINSNRPSVPEFRRIVDAMNRLSAKVQEMLTDAERTVVNLRAQTFQDPVTGLPNQRRFMDILHHAIDDPELFHRGALILLELNDLKAYDMEFGHEAGDRLLKQTAQMLRERLDVHEGVHYAHFSGATFAILLERHRSEQVKLLLQQLAEGLADLHRILSVPGVDVGHIGGAIFNTHDASDLLAEADQALRQAQREKSNSWVLFDKDDQQQRPAIGAGEWQSRLLDAMSEERFRFVWQPVLSTKDRQLIHRELFLRLDDPERGELNAGIFMPMVEATGLASQLDRWVLEKLLKEMKPYESAVSVNISSLTLKSDSILPWLRHRLLGEPSKARRLVLDFPEYGAVIHVDALKQWIDALSPLGVRFALDNFGRSYSSFAYLRSLKAHYVKLDGSFIRDLDDSADHQFYVQALCRIARGLDMDVIAESVETAAVWERLQQFGVDGGRGYWLGRPE